MTAVKVWRPVLYLHCMCVKIGLYITGQVHTSKSSVMCRALKIHCRVVFCAFWIHIHIWPHTSITTMNYLCEISTINNTAFLHLDSSRCWMRAQYQPLSVTPLINRQEGGYLSITGSNNKHSKNTSISSQAHTVCQAITPFPVLQSPWTVAFPSRRDIQAWEQVHRYDHYTAK